MQVWQYPLGWRWLNALYTPLPCNSFLVKHEASWLLVDAGPSDTYLQNAATDLAAAVKAKIPASDSLAAILGAPSACLLAHDHVGLCSCSHAHLACMLAMHARTCRSMQQYKASWHAPSKQSEQCSPQALRRAVTHVHPDHVGAIPLLLEAYPKALVIVHATERVYLTHNYSFFPPSMGLRWLGVIPTHQVQVPDSRILSLHNERGELFEAFGGSRNPLPPVVKQLTYVHLPGTSPGNTVFLHHPTGALFAGDTVFTKASTIPRSKPILSLPLTQGYQADADVAEESAGKLVDLPFTTIWPTHDLSRTGYNKQEAINFNKTINEVDPEFLKWDAGYMPKKRKRKPAAAAGPASAAAAPKAAPAQAPKPSFFQYSKPKVAAR